MLNQHRDTLASYIGHHNLMEFFAIAENESKARVKFNFLQVYIINNRSVMYIIVMSSSRKCCSLVVYPMKRMKMIKHFTTEYFMTH